MIAAMILFAAFHFLPAEKDSDETGWVIWQAVFLILRHSADLDALAGIGLASFLMFSVLIVSSPFLIGVWRKSKLALGLAAAFSGLGTFGFWIMVLCQGGEENFPLGFWCLMHAPLLNFLGLLLAIPRSADSLRASRPE
jgi:hypothetical protein